MDRHIVFFDNFVSYRANQRSSWFVLFFAYMILVQGALMSQPISWKESTQSVSLPPGVKLWKGERSSPALQIWALEVDLKQPSIGIRPYQGDPALVSDFSKSTGAFAAVNGGYFGGSTSYSAVVYPEIVKSQNVSAVTRNGISYPVMRSFFSLNKDLNPSIDWIYHFGEGKSNIYRFPYPLPYTLNDPSPKQVPSREDGVDFQNLLIGIGGGPVLVRDGIRNITYNQEVMWGSGVGLSNRDPRTAVGFTADKRIFLITADGRQAKSEGVSLTELADIFLTFQCTHAMNLDGGGSSAMAIEGSLVNTPSEARKVPSILAVTHRSALQENWQPTFEKILDTQDTMTIIKGNWFESANTGYYGSSKALLTAAGDGTAFVEYPLSVPKDTVIQIYAWWVSASNRAKDTPVLVRHKGGNTIVKLDQSQKGSTWNYLGEFSFHNDGSEFIRIFNQTSSGQYVAADAFKLLSFGLPDNTTSYSSDPAILKGKTLLISPNPGGNIVQISCNKPIISPSTLILSTQSGKIVRQREIQDLPLGVAFPIDVEDLENGLYYIQLKSGSMTEQAALVIMR